MKCRYCGHPIIEDKVFGGYTHERTTSTEKCGYLMLINESSDFESVPCWCENPEPELKESD
jgi:hypothetical protein